MHRVAIVTALLLCAPVTGCAGKSHHAAGGNPTPSAPPAAELAARARTAASTHTAATYQVVRTDGRPTGQRVTIATTAAGWRLDVSQSGRTTTLASTATGAYSCQTGRACQQVARPGQPIPAVVDPFVQEVFVSYPRELADHVARYDVTAAGGDGGPAGPAACYRVDPHPGGTVSAGTYCYTPNGTLTRAAFSSGELRLLEVAPAPTAITVPN
ncbi:MAG: hypothetical protein ACJ73S_24425 [Mycobacteriales bacterium]|jgi:hypothetical protein